jgi:haloacetate dehalogenase
VPILEALERCDACFATAWWHWFFFAQPDKPERAVSADPDAWYGGPPGADGAEAYADYRAGIHGPATIHAMIEDYRAGLGIDREHDEADRRENRRIACPALILWSLKDDLERLHGDVLDVWRPWATILQGRGLNCGHHMAEEAPEELAKELLLFLTKY